MKYETIPTEEIEGLSSIDLEKQGFENALERPSEIDLKDKEDDYDQLKAMLDA